MDLGVIAKMFIAYFPYLKNRTKIRSSPWRGGEREKESVRERRERESLPFGREYSIFYPADGKKARYYSIDIVKSV